MNPAVNHVSASRLPALFDEHRYLTRRILWEYCAKGRKPEADVDNPRARSGRMLEGAILAMAAEDLGCEVIHLPQDRAKNFVLHPSLPTGCMPDGLVLHPTRGPGIISVKNVSPDAWYKRWKPMEHGVPRDVEMQLQTELLVLRAAEMDSLPRPEWACIAALEAGCDLHLFERRIEERWHGALEQALKAFFSSIVHDVPPPFDYVAEELPLAVELWPYSTPDKVQDFGGDFVARSNAAAVIETYLEATARRKEADEQIAALKVELLEMAEDASIILTDTYRCKVSRSEVKALHKECPHCHGEVQVRDAFTRLSFHPKEI